MAYADYEFYTSIYFGTAISSEDFTALSERASRYIDYVTRNRAESAIEKAAEDVKNAMCAIADTLQLEGQLSKNAFSADRIVTSESVGGWSRSFGSASPSSVELKMISGRKLEALQIYLAPHGLLQMRSKP